MVLRTKRLKEDGESGREERNKREKLFSRVHSRMFIKSYKAQDIVLSQSRQGTADTNRHYDGSEMEVEAVDFDHWKCVTKQFILVWQDCLQEKSKQCANIVNVAHTRQ